MRVMGNRFAGFVSAFMLAVVLGTSSVSAQDEKELGWFYTAELSAVLTGGNSVATTLGFGGTIRGIWETTELNIRGGGLRTNTGAITRTAVGSLDDFTVVKNTNTQVTAENYFLRSRLDRIVNEMFFYFGGLSWERNTFSGFNSRITAVAGVGNTWDDTETSRLKTTYGLTFTQQDDVVNNPNTADTFIGGRVGLEYWKQLTGSTTFESLLISDVNFSDFEDLRADWVNAIEVSISEVLALRTALQLLWDNQPALTTVPLEQPVGTPTGDTVLASLGKLDTQFTVALVANF